MPSAKRKKKAQEDSASKLTTTPAGLYQYNFYRFILLILIPNSEPGLNLGVCAPCKRAKSRCRFATGSLICDRCQTKGLSTECVIEPPKPRTRGTRSNSINNLLPSTSSTQGSLTQATAATQRKRSHSDTSGQTNRPTKHPRLASQSSHSSRTPLNSIVEEDELLADTLVSNFDTSITQAGFLEHDPTVQHIRKAQFIDALAGSGNLNDEGSEGSDMPVEDSAEEFDEISDSSGSEAADDEDENLLLSKPVTQQRHSHSRATKSMKTQSRTSGSTKPRSKHERNMENTYDPSTCREWPN
jgi:hypothetical protein